MIRRLENTPEGVVGFEMVGTISSADYTEVLAPLVEEAHAQHEKIRAVCVLGEDFDGYDLGAVWSDTKLGLGNVRAWERVALVSDLGWVRHLSSALGWAVPGDFRVFAVDELPAALEWAARD